MTTFFDVKHIEYQGGPAAQKRALRPIFKKELKNLVRYWHRVFLPGHFKPGAMQKYGYKQRSIGYWEGKRKRNSQGPGQPLVYTGATKRLSRRQPVIVGNSKRATLRMALPWYIRMVPKKRNAPAMGAELTVTAPKEHEILMKRFEQRTARALDNVKTTKRVRV